MSLTNRERVVHHMEENKTLMQDEAEETTTATPEDGCIEEAKKAETTQEQEEKIQEDNQEEATDKASEYLERLQRLMAEFDNYRKRNEKEREGLYDLGVSTAITELLPVVDNFERAIKQTCEDEKYAQGIQMIHKQLLGIFEKLNVTPIEATNQPFDPEKHSAVMHVEDEAFGENMVAEELQKGYMYKEKVIRYSMVKVAN